MTMMVEAEVLAEVLVGVLVGVLLTTVSCRCALLWLGRCHGIQRKSFTYSPRPSAEGRGLRGGA